MKRTINLIVLLIITLGTLSTDEARAHPASGIVVDRNGQIYFSDLETIWKIDPQGKLTVFRAGVRGRHTHELTIDEGGNLYGEDVTYEPPTQRWISAIWKMTPAGSLTYILAPTTNRPRGISIWKDRHGSTYFVEQNNHTKRETLLMRRTPDGKVARLAGGSYGHMDGVGAKAKFGSIGGMAWGPDGSLYLTDGTSVRKVMMDGTVVTRVRNLDAKSSDDHPADEISYGGLMGIAIDSQESVYVADYSKRRLLKVTSEGKVSTVASAERPWSPTGVAVAGSGGDLYVLESGFTLPRTSHGSRVRKISPDGKSRVLATVGEGRAGVGLISSNDHGSEKVTVSEGMTRTVLGTGLGLVVLSVSAWGIRTVRRSKRV